MWQQNFTAPIDTVTNETVLAMVAGVEGLPADQQIAAAAATQKVDAHVKKLQIDFRTEDTIIPGLNGPITAPKVELDPGQSITVWVKMGFTDPYHLKDFILPAGANTVFNKAKVNADIVMPEGDLVKKTQEVKASYGFVELDKKCGPTK